MLQVKQDFKQNVFNGYGTHILKTRGCFLLIDNNATSAIGTLQKKGYGYGKGAADTMFFWRGDLYFFEFKIGNNKQSLKLKRILKKIALIHAKKL